MNEEFMAALDALQAEKNINKEELIQTIEHSIATAYQKNNDNSHGANVHIDRETGEIKIYENRLVVEQVNDPDSEISLEEVKTIEPSLDLGDVYQKPISTKDFGRIAAQNAKQIIIQKIQDAEKSLIYDSYSELVGDMINGTISKVDGDNVYVNIGQAETILQNSEKIKNELYRAGDNLKFYVVGVKKNNKGPFIKISRSNVNLLKRLFEEEVPEIYDGTIEIMNVARDPGKRAKISVLSNDEGIDPVGASVGPKGSRVQNVMNALNGERVDLVLYSSDTDEYIKNALNPAQIIRIVKNPNTKSAIVIVDKDQLSLAIGKDGQNVRLATKLTGWKLDIRSEEEYAEKLRENPDFEAKYTEPKKVKIAQVDKSLYASDLFEDEPEKEEVVEEPKEEYTGVALEDITGLFDN